jgi:hypothetical protein
MPQLDFYTFPLQTNFCIITFFILYFVGIKVILTYFFVNAKLREKIKTFSNKKELLVYTIFF